MTPKGGGVEISFIFFIDIIMAVTGVMLFVIILLVLDLDPNSAVSKNRKANAVKVETVAKPPLADEKRTDPAPVTNANHDDLQNLRSQVEQRQAELLRLKEQVTDAESRTQKANIETEKLSKIANQKFKPVELVVGEATGVQRKAVLIECSQNSIVLQAWGEDARPAICAGDRPETRRESALQSLKEFPKEKFAIVLIVKPSAFAWSPEFLTALREAGYSAGTEPMEEDHTAIKW